MNSRSYLGCYLGWLALAGPALASSLDEARELAAAQQAAQTLVAQLKSELQAALGAGGPVQAIEVCRQRAPAIAAELSAQSGLEVYRTSLKPRARAPDAWETEILHSFAKRQAAGEDATHLEQHAVVMEQGQPVFRYLKALPTQPMCLACHGRELAEPVVASLKARYPDDQAVGYELGEIRGAVSVRHRLPSAPGQPAAGPQ